MQPLTHAGSIDSEAIERLDHLLALPTQQDRKRRFDRTAAERKRQPPHASDARCITPNGIAGADVTTGQLWRPITLAGQPQRPRRYVHLRHGAEQRGRQGVATEQQQRLLAKAADLRGLPISNGLVEDVGKSRRRLLILKG